MDCTRPSDQSKKQLCAEWSQYLQSNSRGGKACRLVPSSRETEATASPLTEGLLAHAHFNHDPLHRSSQDKKEGQEPVDSEPLLPGHPLQNSPHLGPEEHARLGED
jgi:hypothetical protein